jgi:Helix-turn-helix domain
MTKFLPLKVAAAEIGITPSTLRMLCRAGEGPVAHKVGKRLFKILRSDLDDYIAATTLRTAA